MGHLMWIHFMDHIFETQGWREIYSVFTSPTLDLPNKKLFPWNKMIFDFLCNRANHFLRAFRHFSNTFMRHNEFSQYDTSISNSGR